MRRGGGLVIADLTNVIFFERDVDMLRRHARRTSMRLPVFVVCWLTCMSLTGCFLVPFIEAANDVGMTASSRRATLGEALKKYEEAVYWGNLSDAMAFVAPEKREGLRRVLGKVGRGPQVVSTNVVSTSFDDSVQKARVTVATKRFSKDTLVVAETFEEQLWMHSVGDGWQLHEKREVREDEAVGG